MILAWIRYNPNPSDKLTIDCVVRAVAIAEGISWEEAHEALSKKARDEADMPSVNPVWADYLKDRGYSLFGLPNTCPRCYTVRDFARDYSNGTYVLGTGDHAVAVIDGNYIDTWNSGDEVPMYFFMKPTKEMTSDGRTAANIRTTEQPTNRASGSATSDGTSIHDTATDSWSVPGAGTSGSPNVQVEHDKHDGLPVGH